MSSTRYASDGRLPRQERFASDPEYSGAINALLAAKRIALVEDQELRAVLWYIQFRSLQPLGLKDLSRELFDFFPDRIGSPTMRRIGLKPEKVYGPKIVREIRAEIPNSDFPIRGDVIKSYNSLFSFEDKPEEPDKIINEPASYTGEEFLKQVRDAALSLPEHLTEVCLNPNVALRDTPAYNRESVAGVWYFENLLEGIQLYRRHCAANALKALAETEISELIYQTLGFCFRQRRMVLIEGGAGIGKTATVKAWCNLNPGLVRYVEIPSSNDDRSFYLSIAEALGVARGSAYNGQQIKLKVEDALRASGLMLVMDEAQFAWPQKYNRPQGVPIRMQWIKTAFDNGTPIALVGLPEFSDWQALYVKKTLWRDNQFVRRNNRRIVLPAAHSLDDLIRIAKAIHPAGDELSWNQLAGCAIALPNKQASAIVEIFISALDIAQQDGRSDVTYEDIAVAMRFDFPPCESEPAPVQKTSSAVAVQVRGKGDAADSTITPSVVRDRTSTSIQSSRRRNGRRCPQPLVT